jgi:hypothetical protein
MWWAPRAKDLFADIVQVTEEKEFYITIISAEKSERDLVTKYEFFPLHLWVKFRSN